MEKSLRLMRGALKDLQVPEHAKEDHVVQVSVQIAEPLEQPLDDSATQNRRAAASGTASEVPVQVRPVGFPLGPRLRSRAEPPTGEDAD